MSSGKACVCSEKNRDDWVILHYKHNHSAFETPKYGRHRSAYSVVQCKRCLMVWSTKADYVESLRLEEVD